MKSHISPVVVEPDEDKWRAYGPKLKSRGAAIWGHTREEALRNIQEVAQMVLEEMIEDGEPIPMSIHALSQPAIAVNP